ncbi:MAG: WD40 repeat domain-containing protein, partial [Acidobacteria bacterium]|nr:WD40 repeat domain-containing protein [Acidobacteriota bacterium]
EMKRALRSAIQSGGPAKPEIKTEILPAPTPTLPAAALFTQPAPPPPTRRTPVHAPPALLPHKKWLWAAGGLVALLLAGVLVYAVVRSLSANKSTANRNTAPGAGSQSRSVVPRAPEKWALKQVIEQGVSTDTLAFSPDGKYLAFDGDNNLVLWNIETGSVQSTIKYANITHLEFSPDSKTIVTSSTDPHIKIWDVETGSLKQEIKEGSTTIYRAVFSPDGKLVAFNDGQKHIVWWNVQTGEIRRSRGEDDAYYLNDLAFSPDGKILASCASYGAEVKLWDVQTLALIRELKGHTEEIEAVAFSPDGKTLASGGWDKQLKLWDVATGNLKQSLNNVERVGCIAFHPDGKIIAAGGFDNYAVKIWDVQAGTLKQTLEGHSDLVWAVAFSPDGKSLASGGYGKDSNKTLILWQGIQP